MIYRAHRCERRHHVRAPSKGPHGQTAPNHLAQGREVRRDVVEALGAAGGHAKARHDLIEDQKGAGTRAERAKGIQEGLIRGDAIHIARDGLDDNAGDFRASRGKEGRDRLHIVIGQGQGVLREVRRYPGGVRLTQGQGTGARLDQQGIDMAVVAAFEFHHAIPSREPPGEAQGAHGCFRSRVHHAHLGHGRHHAHDLLRHGHF